MKCSNCNNEIDADSVFCEYCGVKLQQTSQQENKSSNLASNKYLNLLGKFLKWLGISFLILLGWVLLGEILRWVLLGEIFGPILGLFVLIGIVAVCIYVRKKKS